MGKGLFLSRDPVLAVEEFIGREAELAWLADKLSRPAPQNCNLVGEPRIGKTSLLHHVYRKQIGAPPGTKGLYVWARPVQLPTLDSLSFWQLMGRRLRAAGEAAGISVSAADPNGAVAARPWFDWVDEMVDGLATKGWRIIFLIDDFDLLPGQITPQDLNWLRSLSTRYGETLAFVIASADSLVTLTGMVGEETAVSPFANIFHTLHLGLLARPAAATLCRRAAEVEEVPLSSSDIAFLLREAGRHPALLKIAAGFLLERRRQGQNDEATLHTDTASYLRFDGQVRWLCRQLIERRNSVEQAALCALADGKTAALADDPILCSRLQHQLGLVEEREGRLSLFADAFQYWACPARRETEEEAGEEKTAVLPPLTHLPERRRVRIDGDEIPLTPLENRLLAYLVNQSGQVCARHELLENVWEPGRSLAVVEKAVNRLRGKIEPDPKRPRYILSARGEGYVLRQT